MTNIINFNEMTILKMQELLDSGEITSTQLTEFYLKRIESVDKNGPSLHAILQINSDALHIAEALDKERMNKGKRSELHGIPVLLKANIDTADKMETNAGSLALEGHIAEKDAFIVKRLRESGAVILGKTNLSEWANFRSTRSSSGWSSAGGQTRNPYVTDRSPCGSSSGSAVAVSANLCAVAVGTETDGSIVCPSQMNGLVGIKPTLGLVSRNGIIPIAHSQDTAGPMARNVSDAVILLNALAANDTEDQVFGMKNRINVKDYSVYLNKNALKGVRIGVARNFFGFHDKVDELMERSIKLMKEHGAIIVDPVEIATKDKYDDEEFEVLLYEFKKGLNKYLSSSDGKVKSLKDLIEFNVKEKEKMMPFFQQEILEKAQEKGSLDEKTYVDALKKCREYSREKGIDLTLKKHALKAIIAPTGGPAWKIDLINGDNYSGGCSSAAAVSGYPHITVPNGFIFGLPVGISFFGSAYSEPDLIGLAYAFEQISRFRKEPQFIEGSLYG